MRSKRWNDETGLRRLGLEPRATIALGVVALGLFLLISLAKYGAAGTTDAGEVAWHVGFAGWFVDVFGAGAWLLVLLPTIWGVIVYFRESTPNLALRAAGVVVLACATAMITGLLQEVPGPWAGSVGAFAVWLAEALGTAFGRPIAQALVWCGSIVLFVTSLIWATDWMFHSVRRGEQMPLRGLRQVALESSAAQLRDAEHEDAAAAERGFVRAAAPPAAVAEAVRAAGHLVGEHEDETGLPRSLTADAAVPDVTDFVEVDMGQEVNRPDGLALPAGFSAMETDDRVVVRPPTGYRGVEFLPPSDELLEPTPREAATFDTLDFGSPSAVSYADDETFDAVFTPAAPELRDESTERSDPYAAAYDDAYDAEPDEPDEPDEIHEVDAAAAARVDDVPAAATVEADDDAIPAIDVAVFSHSAPVAENEHDDEPRPAAPLFQLIDDDLVPFVERTAPTVEIAHVEVPAYAEPPVVVETAAAVTAPVFAEPPVAEEAPRRSGIGIPADSPFVDEFYPREPYPGPVAGEPSDGAASHDEVASTYGGAPRVSSSFPETVTSAELLLPAETAVTPAPPQRTRMAPPPGAGRLDRLHAMELDPLFSAAVDAVLDGGRGSPMVLQRRLGIGHGRGLRILSQMERAGVVGPEDHTGARSVQLSRTEWDAFVGSNQL